MMGANSARQQRQRAKEKEKERMGWMQMMRATRVWCVCVPVHVLVPLSCLVFSCLSFFLPINGRSLSTLLSTMVHPLSFSLGFALPSFRSALLSLKSRVRAPSSLMMYSAWGTLRCHAPHLDLCNRENPARPSLS